MNKNQGKSPPQYRDSAMFAFIGFIGILGLCLIMVIASAIPGCKEFNQKVSDGIGNDPRPANHLFNYTYPSFYDTLTAQDSLELKEPDAIYYDTINDDMRDIDMDCGDKQPIPKYESFYDVPASTDSLIIVDDILYRRGREKWIPVYPDEYVMWISSNGDTIWE